MITRIAISIALIFIFCFLGINSAVSMPIFTVAGAVTNNDESLAKNGLEVIVNNETKNLTSRDILGKQETGKYGVVFIDTNNKSVAD